MSTDRGLVIDASVVVDSIDDGGRADAAREVIGSARLHAPHLLDLEVLSAVARWERAGDLGAAAATRAVEKFQSLPVTRHEMKPWLSSVWDLRDRLRVADAFYVALAGRLGLELVTSDRRLGRVVRDQNLADVVVVE